MIFQSFGAIYPPLQTGIDDALWAMSVVTVIEKT